MRYFSALLVLGLGLAALAVTPVPASEDFTSVNSEFTRFLSDTDFNGAILVARNGKVVYKNASGYADVDFSVPLTTRSSFNLASVSKQFTATGIMILFERNELKLDDPVADYLPQLSYAEGITIRHLLQHTSGLPDIYDMLEAQWDKSKVAGNEVLLELFSEQKPKPMFEPGRRMQYSNTGYIILASVIEKISGMPFHDFMKKKIFDLLEMNDTFAYYKTLKAYPRPERVWGLKREEGKVVLNDLIYCDGMRGDGNVHSSIEDLFKWDRALYTENLLKKETLEMMFTAGHTHDGAPFSYGFGWGVNRDPSSVSHGGAWVGFRSSIIRYLDTQDTIIVLINCISPETGNVVEKIKKRYLR